MCGYQIDWEFYICEQILFHQTFSEYSVAVEGMALQQDFHNPFQFYCRKYQIDLHLKLILLNEI